MSAGSNVVRFDRNRKTPESKRSVQSMTDEAISFLKKAQDAAEEARRDTEDSTQIMLEWQDVLQRAYRKLGVAEVEKRARWVHSISRPSDCQGELPILFS